MVNSPSLNNIKCKLPSNPPMAIVNSSSLTVQALSMDGWKSNTCSQVSSKYLKMSVSVSPSRVGDTSEKTIR